MKDWKKAEDVAAYRVQLLSPLLEDGLDKAQLRKRKAEICAQTGVSERTLRRHLTAFAKDGFEGLKPKAKSREQGPAIPDEILEEAILLRREVPSRSVSQIIRILEWEDKVEPGQIRRTTLQEKLTQRGYSAGHMRMYAETGIAARRFQRRHRNQLWQSDLKYGPYLPIGPNGTKQQVYLVVMLDDATRFVLHGMFYPTLDQAIVEDCFRQAVQKHGIPEAVYFDNGKQFRTKWMTRTCSKLGTHLLYAKPYAPESKGKIERFNRIVDSFLSEVAVARPKTLEQLNQQFYVWLSECYQNQPHSALRNQMSPEAAYRSDRKSVRFAASEIIADAFLHAEVRKVDKSGCINFMGKKYEVGLSFIGRKVHVTYDPADITELTIQYEGHQPWMAKELVIGERAGQRPKLPERFENQTVDASRLLDVAEKKHQERYERTTPAVRYDAVWKEDNGRV